MSVPVGVGNLVHGRWESWYSLLTHKETGVVKRSHSQKPWDWFWLLQLALSGGGMTHWTWGRKPQPLAAVSTVAAFLCDFGQFSDTFYFPKWTEWLFMGLLQIGQTAVCKVAFKTFSCSHWKGEISRSSVELQGLERQVCIHFSIGSQILPTSGMTH